VSEKVCKRCKMAKPLDAFSKHRLTKDGFMTNCRACEVIRVKEWAKSNPEKVAAWAEKNRQRNLRTAVTPGTTQACTKCGESKLLSEFHANPRNKLNVRKICKACTSEHMEKKYQENPEKLRAKTAKWRKENPDVYKAYMDAYHLENREALNEYRRQLRLRNLEREREKDKRYLKNNRAKVYAKNARRRAAETQATPAWLTAIQKAQIYEFYEIALARTLQTGISCDVDHIVPLRGKHVRGLHVPWNLQILTEEENARKYNKLLEVRS